MADPIGLLFGDFSPGLEGLNQDTPLVQVAVGSAQELSDRVLNDDKSRTALKAKTPRRKLVLYSGGNHAWGNERLHRRMLQMAVQSGKARSVTYVPSTHENGAAFFRKFKRRYQKYGAKVFRYFPVDAVFTKQEMRKALQSDVIYLAGGNTFYFLKHLRSSGFLSALKKFLARGGVLAGLSAGAIILTPDVFLAGYPSHEGDENEVRLKDLRGLAAVDFEFIPHYTPSAKTNAALLKYSRRTDRPILACPDGSGLAVDGEDITFFGPAFLFAQGKKIRIA
jgi:dipeptidase E